MRIYLIGMMGSGKSTVGKILAERLHFPFYDLDSIIERREQLSVKEIFRFYSEQYFRSKETEALKHLTLENSKAIIATGGGTPCFHNGLSFMNDNGITVFLKCSITHLAERLRKEKHNRPLLAKDDPTSGILKRIYSEREMIYNCADFIVDAGQLPERVAEQVIAFLKETGNE